MSTYQLARRALRAVPKRCRHRKSAAREIIRSVTERGWSFADALTDALFVLPLLRFFRWQTVITRDGDRPITPAEVVEWLKDDDGALGRASQEACEEAAKNDEAFGKAFVEEVE